MRAFRRIVTSVKIDPRKLTSAHSYFPEEREESLQIARFAIAVVQGVDENPRSDRNVQPTLRRTAGGRVPTPVKFAGFARVPDRRHPLDYR